MLKAKSLTKMSGFFSFFVDKHAFVLYTKTNSCSDCMFEYRVQGVIIMKKHKKTSFSFLLIPATIIMLFVFFILFGNHAAAEEGDLNQIQRYESILIKDGDTLSSISNMYAKKFSHYTQQTYMEAIIDLNNLSSEYIHSGNYILLPVYH